MAKATWGSIDLGGTVGMLHAGVQLRVAHWPALPTPGQEASGPDTPQADDAPGTVILVQGRGEFIEFYAETIADLRARGFAVVAFDLRGQGGSERRAARGGHVESFRRYGEDLSAVVHHAAELGLPRPFTVLAHSTGGLAALRAQPRLAGEVARMVLLAPLLDIAEPPLPRWLIGMLARAAALLGLARVQVAARKPPPTPASFAENRLTSDPERYRRLCALVADNPDLTVGPPTFGWVRAAFAAMARARSARGRLLEIPTLFIASGADRIVSTPAIERFARGTPGGGLVLLHGARHQAAFERDEVRRRFLAAFTAFVREKPRERPVRRRARAGAPPRFEPAMSGDPDAALARILAPLETPDAAQTAVEPAASAREPTPQAAVADDLAAEAAPASDTPRDRAAGHAPSAEPRSADEGTAFRPSRPAPGGQHGAERRRPAALRRRGGDGPGHVDGAAGIPPALAGDPAEERGTDETQAAAQRSRGQGRGPRGEALRARRRAARAAAARAEREGAPPGEGLADGANRGGADASPAEAAPRRARPEGPDPSRRETPEPDAEPLRPRATRPGRAGRPRRRMREPDGDAAHAPPPAGPAPIERDGAAAARPDDAKTFGPVAGRWEARAKGNGAAPPHRRDPATDEAATARRGPARTRGKGGRRDPAPGPTGGQR